jgi:putative membrane-bound dehydrogenase-like protein
MKRMTLAGLALIVAASGLSGYPGEAKPLYQAQLDGHTFTLPVGFEIERVAGPPLVNRPIEADFDEEGRLYVTDSSGSNDPVKVQIQKKPHRVMRLEDTKGTGKFDRCTVFAEHLMFPEGALWYKGSFYTAAPPSIWKLTDTKGKGVADRRVEWFKGRTLTGCANDLHGPYLGLDGWIYWCKGAFAEQTYERPGKPPFVTKAAHIFRSKPDGTALEPVMTGGMDNPVEVVFTPGGERIFTTTFLQHPGGGLRDGLIHAIYGGIYGKDHDPIYKHKWTSPSLMPPLVHLGAAAPCGLVRYESDVFGHEYQNNLFACLFNMHKVTRHILAPSGSTFKTRDEDFLVSSNPDFHPTDVLEDADGSLLVIDTGGWYKLCCPSSQLHKPDILGAIYRISRKDAPRMEDPRGLKLAWSSMSSADLVKLLDDGRPAVRRRAIQTLADVGKASLTDLSKALATRDSPLTRLNAVWAATRIDDPRARAAVRSALHDENETVRQAAIHSASVWRDREAEGDLCRLLRGPSLHNKRAAAEALGRIGDSTAIPVLFEALGHPADRSLEHSLTYALIEIAEPDKTAGGLENANPLVRRAALTALDQMDGSKLAVSMITADLTSKDSKLKETAWWIAGRHAEWGDSLARFLDERLTASHLTEPERSELIGQAARLAKSKPVQGLLMKRVADTNASPESRRLALHAMARADLREAPWLWIDALLHAINCKDADLQSDVLATLRSLRVSKDKVGRLINPLLAFARDANKPPSIRVAALAAIPEGLPRIEPAVFQMLVEQLDASQSAAVRSIAAEVLSRTTLDNAQLKTLCKSIKTAGPMELERLLEAFSRCGDEQVGLGLVAALGSSGTAKSALRADTLKRALAKYSPAVQKEAQSLLAAVDVDAAKQRARLEGLVSTLGTGDVRRGQAIFNGPKAVCSTCHAIGYLGGKIGPDLTRIGSIRTERDLLESIVFPSASFVRSYEPMLVMTKDGKAHNGLIRKDTPEEITLTINANQEERILRSDIEEIQPSKVSIMPAGLDQQLTAQELADLVAFLKACK